VLSVNRATSIIADGDIIEVDGYAGVVRRSTHKSQEAA
jgi:phosphohistidine swiveling domain-containing protein